MNLHNMYAQLCIECIYKLYEQAQKPICYCKSISDQCYEHLFSAKLQAALDANFCSHFSSWLITHVG